MINDRYKMICVDVDGTLLNSEHRISAATRKAILSISNKILVVLVSARPPAGIRCFTKEMGIKAPVISYNGALVFDEQSNIIYSKTIPAGIIRNIYYQYKNNISLNLYAKDKWYVGEEDEWVKKEGEITGLQPEIMNMEKLICDKDNKQRKNIIKEISDITKGINKVLLIGSPWDIDKANNFLKKYKNQLEIYRSKPNYLEIVSKGVSKTRAIKMIQQRYDIDKSEIIAIGDNYNDLDMIKYAGLGVAMGNAPEQVRIDADKVTLSNDENGVASVIKDI